MKPASILKTCAIAILWAALCQAKTAHASLTLLVGEPYGAFGTMMPSGHSSIYLDRVCADGPFKLRMCLPGEPQGVVIARYDHIGDTDWIATPILQYLYAVDSVQSILPYATPQSVWELRQTYRRRTLLALVPDGTERAKPTSEWWESAGVAYDRRLWGYRLDTTLAQDRQFVAAMNARPNRHIYRLHGLNCADFTAGAVNFYFPGAVHIDRLADLNLMSPKQVARCVYAYGLAHPEAHLAILEIPQVPGSLRRSRPVRCFTEGLLKTKRYVATLAVIQPEAVPILLTLYLDRGRWQIGQDATPVPPTYFANPATPAPNFLAQGETP